MLTQNMKIKSQDVGKKYIVWAELIEINIDFKINL